MSIARILKLRGAGRAVNTADAWSCVAGRRSCALDLLRKLRQIRALYSVRAGYLSGCVRSERAYACFVSAANGGHWTPKRAGAAERVKEHKAERSRPAHTVRMYHKKRGRTPGGTAPFRGRRGMLREQASSADGWPGRASAQFGTELSERQRKLGGIANAAGGERANDLRGG
jgi:hypothetical protein